MKNQIKNIVYKKSFIFTILALFLIGGAFYWFAYRPAKIRHDCSWVKWIDPATLAEPAITKEDVKNSQLEYEKCIQEVKIKDNQVDSALPKGSFFDGLFVPVESCGHLLK